MGHHLHVKATVTPGGGLFGPQSITWRVHTETPAWPAVLRAFQLQALHPRTIRGIAQNCLLDDPEVAHAWLRHHLDLLAVRTFGTREQAEHAYERVRGLRARLLGLDPGTGTLFRLDEQENLRWAHCAEVASHLEVARRSGVRLSAAERDAYVAEQRRVALLAGLADAPGDTAELDACVDALRPGLAATGEARRAVRRSVSPALPLRLALLTQPFALLTRPLGFFTEPLALLARPLAIGSLPAMRRAGVRHAARLGPADVRLPRRPGGGSRGRLRRRHNAQSAARGFAGTAGTPGGARDQRRSRPHTRGHGSVRGRRGCLIAAGLH